jgi:hypothetical protein
MRLSIIFHFVKCISTFTQRTFFYYFPHTWTFLLSLTVCYEFLVFPSIVVSRHFLMHLQNEVICIHNAGPFFVFAFMLHIRELNPSSHAVSAFLAVSHLNLLDNPLSISHVACTSLFIDLTPRFTWLGYPQFPLHCVTNIVRVVYS